MGWNRDITPIGWLIVGMILIGSGVRLMIVREVYGKVRMPGQLPSIEGWPVFFGGLGEMLLGLLLVYWFLRKTRE